MNTLTSGDNNTNVDHPTIGGQAAAVDASQVEVEVGKTMKTSIMKKTDVAAAKEGRAQVEKQSSDNGHDDDSHNSNKHEEKKQTSSKRRRRNSPHHRPRKHHIPREAPRLVQSPDEYACITDENDESSKTYYDYLPYEVRRDIDRLCPKLTPETHPSSFVIVHPRGTRET